MELPGVLLFGLKTCKGCNIHNFTKFPGLGLCFIWNFQGYREKPKTIHVFLKSMSWPPVCFFSGVVHSKTIHLNWSYKALAKKKALTIYQDRAFASFSCVQLLSSILQRFAHLYCDINSLGERSTGILEIKPTPSSSPAFSQYICLLVNIISKGRKKPQPYSILWTVFKWY